MKEGSATNVKLDVPIVDDRQSAHLQITGTLKDPAYKVANGELVFERTLHGLRNTVLLPAGWDVVGRLAVGDDRDVSGARVRRADQPERREQLPRSHPRAATGLEARSHRPSRVRGP